MYYGLRLCSGLVWNYLVVFIHHLRCWSLVVFLSLLLLVCARWSPNTLRVRSLALRLLRFISCRWLWVIRYWSMFLMILSLLVFRRTARRGYKSSHGLPLRCSLHPAQFRRVTLDSPTRRVQATIFDEPLLAVLSNH